MRTVIGVLLLAALPLLAQGPSAEQLSLKRALSETSNSPAELVLALENHLKQYPNSPQRAELEKAIVKIAMDLNDDQRLITYGENVLSRDPNNLQILEHLTTALLHQGDKTHAEQALDHALHFSGLIEATYADGKPEPATGAGAVKHKDEYDRGRARGLLLQARAQGLLGHAEQAGALAQSSYAIFPSVEGAREAARWLSAAGKDAEALQSLTEAFTISTLRSADTDGASDRNRIGELYRKLHGSESGLGDLILKTYDTTSAQLAARRAELRQLDPNAQIKNPIQFTLTGLDGGKLELRSLLGKVIVLDFWATWCVPCREQHPLYETVKERFKDTDDVVFLAIDTDEDRSLVKPFLTQVKWNSQKVYFEDGLQPLLQVSSIPTTVILGKNGELFTRMIGFLPDRFVDMLTNRVDDALGRPHTATPAAPTPARVLNQ